MKSMTGYGEAMARLKDGVIIRAEIRSVNHRFFNLKTNLPASLNIYEADIEELIKKYIRRGSVNLVIREGRQEKPELNIQTGVLKNYHRQLKRLQKELGLSGGISIETLISLPGALEVADKDVSNAKRQWLNAERVVKAALQDMVAMRERESQRLAKGLLAIIRKMSALVNKIQALAPQVRTHYEKSLKERLSHILSSVDHNNNISQGLANEVMLFAQRSDVTEEIERLKSHITEFERTMKLPNEAGKKLDFIAQEMLREVTTIGAKANNSKITYNVITLKGNVEKLKEQVQNIE
ncbi:MAG: YicC/YloC family endoribonuclease [Candidatus Brocadiia bacterium]